MNEDDNDKLEHLISEDLERLRQKIEDIRQDVEFFGELNLAHNVKASLNENHVNGLEAALKAIKEVEKLLKSH